MNSSKEFLEELAEELRYLPAKQVNEVLKHYRDKINNETDYGTPIDKVLASLKSPAEIAKGIYEMHGVNYLAKRKRHTKVKDIFSAGVSGIIGICSIFLFFGITYFFSGVMFNQFTLIVNAFGFNSVLDIILTTLCVTSYILIMLVILIFIADLFIILLNGLLGKILDAKESTRNKSYEFMDVTFTGWFEKITKKPKFLFKLLFGLVIAFLITGISSYATKGYINRTIRNVTSKTEVVEINEQFDNIYVNANEVGLSITVDESLTNPTLTYEYEFNEYSYSVNNGSLVIEVEKNKTYDFLGLIQAPTSKIKLALPKGFDFENINIEINYGDIYLSGVSEINDLAINTLNGNIQLGDNNILNETNINLSVGNIVSKGNKYNVLNINHASGEFVSGEEEINKFTHINGSSKVTTVGSSIIEYSLVNNSGSLYLEDLSGDSIKINTKTSVNYLYDINYRIGDFEINSTCNFNIVRSYFSEKISTLSNNKSYQILEFVKSPIMDIKGLDGTIICNNINTNYTYEDKKAIKEDYHHRVDEYNNHVLSSSKVSIISYEANISVDDLTTDELYFEQTRNLSTLNNINVPKSTMIFYSGLSNISEFYGETIEMKAQSRSITDKSSIDFVNQKESELVVNLERDGASDFVYSENFTVNFK